MTQFNPENKDELSFHEIFELARKIKDKDDAQQYIREYSRWIMIKSLGKFPKEESLNIAKENFGYWAGYFGNEERKRTETLFECEHPYFGSIVKNGPPTNKQAFEIGLAMGKKLREENRD